ncbi:SAVED domain-containing protein [Clostridium sp.]|uniref:SAVED domain-containing protein n=1 Tax=Clostridium sp. TaxID=1506 RepID=UPI002622BCAD|nr:SAVED domain-containing protein [uncultured Clostridium sp.]
MAFIEPKEVLLYCFSKYKESREKGKSSLEISMAYAFAKTCQDEVSGYIIKYCEEGSSLISFMAMVVNELDIKAAISVTKIDKEEFIHKIKENHIIEVETKHGSTDAVELSSFYNIFYERFLKKFKAYILENPYAEKKANFEGHEQIIRAIDALSDTIIEKESPHSMTVEDSIIAKPVMVLVRSWVKGTEEVIEQCEKKHVLDCVKYFDGRKCKNSMSWNEIKDKISEFANSLSCSVEYCIDISAHYTIAYYLGLVLSSKSGKKAYVNQRGIGGINPWRPWTEENKNEYKMFDVESSEIDNQSNDIAICISATINIFNDVKEYIGANDIKVKKMVNFSFTDKSGNLSVVNGEHAFKLAQQIKNVLNNRTLLEKNGQLHLFFSAPVSLVFFLGQISFLFRNINLYEYTGIYNYKEIYSKTLLIEKGEV